MQKKYKMKKLDELTPLKKTLKQKIYLRAQRMRRYEKRIKLYKKKIYRELGKSQGKIEKPPSKEEVETFWSSTRGCREDINSQVKFRSLFKH